MTTLTWFDDPLTYDRIFEVGGFARVRVNGERVMDAAVKRFPILSPMPRLALENYEQVWLNENIAPLVWLSMPVHESAPTGETPERTKDDA